MPNDCFQVSPSRAYCVFCCGIVESPMFHIVKEAQLELLMSMSEFEGYKFGIGAPYCCLHHGPHEHEVQGPDQTQAMQIDESGWEHEPPGRYSDDNGEEAAATVDEEPDIVPLHVASDADISGMLHPISPYIHWVHIFNTYRHQLNAADSMQTRPGSLSDAFHVLCGSRRRKIR